VIRCFSWRSPIVLCIRTRGPAVAQPRPPLRQTAQGPPLSNGFCRGCDVMRSHFFSASTTPTYLLPVHLPAHCVLSSCSVVVVSVITYCHLTTHCVFRIVCRFGWAEISVRPKDPGGETKPKRRTRSVRSANIPLRGGRLVSGRQRRLHA